MDRQTLLLELIGLSRVVTGDVRDLVYKRHAITELAEQYEPVNPFWAPLDEIKAELIEASQRSIFENLFEEERSAFLRKWQVLRPDEQLRYLDSYVREGQT